MTEQAPSTGYTLRLRLLIANALVFATPVVAGAAVSIALERPGVGQAIAVLLFLALALLAELKPVPLEEDDLSTVSLAFVFILAGASGPEALAYFVILCRCGFSIVRVWIEQHFARLASAVIPATSCGWSAALISIACPTKIGVSRSV